ncbi:MAG: phosphate ABC transporter substrate-binding protein PstS [Bacillati bacterium ANGP1]|uniref:Phosphate-binding protein n=1 Tax=Candidatus Segetimicrobium genomatis TaxID=2569760 RepID=A0A537IMZ2_9BACT|nr:MAG: phosphate ABC transporter substrate-binding protein PstS [Terrabacteria group bacterium ANGP1]
MLAYTLRPGLRVHDMLVAGMNRFVICALIAAVVGMTALTPVAPTEAQTVALLGAGATFAFPLYVKWSQAYALERGVRVTYQPVGSGEGSQASGQVLYLPMVAGSVVPLYNIKDVEPKPAPPTPGVPPPPPPKAIGPGLAFTGPVLADIFLGKIKNWDDLKITELNPQEKMPSTPITVIHRSDGSGTTAIWTNYLSKVSREWKDSVGEGSSVKWPAGLEARGNQGVADLVKRTANSIGYVELAYAVTNRMTLGSVRNKAGQLLAPSLTTTTKALDAALPGIPDDYLTLMTNPDTPDAYPIVGLTYLMVYNEQRDSVKGPVLAQFLWWAIHDGQKHAPPLLYAPLPRNLVVRLERTVKGITVNGQPALP